MSNSGGSVALFCFGNSETVFILYACKWHVSQLGIVCMKNAGPLTKVWTAARRHSADTIPNVNRLQAVGCARALRIHRSCPIDPSCVFVITKNATPTKNCYVFLRNLTYMLGFNQGERREKNTL